MSKRKATTSIPKPSKQPTSDGYKKSRYTPSTQVDDAEQNPKMTTLSKVCSMITRPRPKKHILEQAPVVAPRDTVNITHAPVETPAAREVLTTSFGPILRRLHAEFPFDSPQSVRATKKFQMYSILFRVILLQLALYSSNKEQLRVTYKSLVDTEASIIMELDKQSNAARQEIPGSYEHNLIILKCKLFVQKKRRYMDQIVKQFYASDFTTPYNNTVEMIDAMCSLFIHN